MVPVYTNQFSMTKNSNNTEIVLKFKHSYPESVINNSGNNQAIMSSIDAAAVVMNYEAAAELRDMLNRMIE